MCGIFGIYTQMSGQVLDQNIIKAQKKLNHRGPDHTGIYECYSRAPHRLVLGHTRLSIIDLSADAQQPMVCSDERYVLVFNGEIYNFRSLREVLKKQGIDTQTQSDSEVLLLAWKAWGESCLEHLNGMFAFALYDKYEEYIYLARDGFGIKPLMYYFSDDTFAFASETGALLDLLNLKSEINWQRAYEYLVFGDYDVDSSTFYKHIYALLPGQLLKFHLSTKQLLFRQWWKPAIKERSDLNFTQASEALRSLFLENVRLHLISDVPIGAALSGGIDSSAIVCAMRYLEPSLPIHTFSFVTHEKNICEEYWIDRVNQKTQAIPHKLALNSEGFIQDIDKLITAQEEPFGGTSIYAQYCLFRHIQQTNIKVILDGQGADELFAGYYGYPGERIRSLFEQKKWLTAIQFLHSWRDWPGRSYKQALMHYGYCAFSDKWYEKLSPMVGRSPKPSWLNINYLQKKAICFTENRLRTERDEVRRRVSARLAFALQHKGLPTLLRHADRNSMAFSIESRVPFLTREMAEFALSMPESFLISKTGETKSLFRAAMRGIVPDDILARRDKIGFSTPENHWLRAIAPQARLWLQDMVESPAFHASALLNQFDSALKPHAKNSTQVWRWINFARWRTLMHVKD